MNGALTPAQTKALRWLAEHGGTGLVDRYGRVVAGGETMPVGSWPAWLNLVAAGMVTGFGGHLRLTTEGWSRFDDRPEAAA